MILCQEITENVNAFYEFITAFYEFRIVEVQGSYNSLAGYRVKKKKSFTAYSSK